MFKKIRLPVILFFVIIIVAAFLRFYRLSNVPPGVNRDEASIGYTAYSLLNTGRDEYGRFLPLSFESFGDWKLPLYIYLTVPMVKIFGMTEIAVRVTSAIAGILTVALVFFLVRQLFKNNTLAYLAMALTAIAPWSLHLSRVESESNVAVFLTTLAAFLFFKADKKSSWLYLVSFLLWGLTYFTYAGNHIFTTLLVFGILILYRPTISANKFAKTGLVLFVVLAAVIFSQTLFGADKTKISGISIFSNPFVIYENIDLQRLEHNNPGSLAAVFIHNRLVFALETVTKNYLKSFSPEFLAISGGTNHAHNINNFGNMYLIEYPFLILGFFYLLSQIKDSKYKLILWWLLISPVAAAITKDAPHTNRMYAVFPVLPLLVAFGINWLWSQINRKKLLSFTMICLIVSAYLINFGVYMDRYYVHFPKDETQYWGFWHKELVKTLNSDINRNKKIIMSHPEQSPYIFMLFYSRFDPAAYQREALRYPATEDGFYHVNKYDRFEFRTINWDKDLNRKDTIVIELGDEVPKPLLNRAIFIGQFALFSSQKILQ